MRKSKCSGVLEYKLTSICHTSHNIIDKKDKKVWLVDIAIPGDSRTEDKELQKITRYKDPQIETERLSHKKARVMLIIIGALGAILKRLEIT